MIDGFSRLFHKPSQVPAPTPPQAKNNSNINVALVALGGLAVFNTAMLAYMLSQKNEIPWIDQNRELNGLSIRLTKVSHRVDSLNNAQEDLRTMVSNLEERVVINEAAQQETFHQIKERLDTNESIILQRLGENETHSNNQSP